MGLWHHLDNHKVTRKPKKTSETSNGRKIARIAPIWTKKWYSCRINRTDGIFQFQKISAPWFASLSSFVAAAVVVVWFYVGRLWFASFASSMSSWSISVAAAVRIKCSVWTASCAAVGLDGQQILATGSPTQKKKQRHEYWRKPCSSNCKKK